MIEHQCTFMVYPLYVPTLNHFYCDQCARLTVSEIDVLAKDADLQWVSSGELLAWCPVGNLHRRIAVLPDGPAAQRDFALRLE